MELNRILEIIQANCSVMPSQPSGVVYVFDEDELTATAEQILSEMQSRDNVLPQLSRRDVSGWKELIEVKLKQAEQMAQMEKNEGMRNGYWLVAKRVYADLLQSIS